MHNVSVADILRSHFAEYARAYGPLPYEHYGVANAIMACGTAELGSHVYRCQACGYEVERNNSCRNRHCPTCQGSAAATWVEQRIQQLLPVAYFHVVFTVPSELNRLALSNRKTFYSLLMRAASQTLLELGNNPRRLGGTMGFIAILHTWGQNLMDHPHVHCVVPAGALTHCGKWKRCPAGYLFPIAVLRRLFKGKLLASLKQAQQHRHMPDNAMSSELFSLLYRREWVVYAKPPFAGPEAVLKYVGRYTHRIAISNKRVTELLNGIVTFSYRDYADNNRRKNMRLSAVEFIRRFMLHVLPKGFVRIRHYGFLSNRAKRTLLPRCMTALSAMAVPDSRYAVAHPTPPERKRPTCPACGNACLVLAEHIPRPARLAA